MTFGGRRARPVPRTTAPRELLDQEPFASALHAYAEEHGRPLAAVREEAAGCLDEMYARHGSRTTRQWHRFGQWMLRAHDVVVDEDDLVHLRRLDRDASLAFLFSHRSYLDGFVLPISLMARRIRPVYTFGGANLDLPVIGQIAKATGLIFIRRSTRDAPLYRLMLRTYITHLAREHANLAWSIEGGRTRTGKLRPPTHGILRYLADAVDRSDSGEVFLVPVSIVYEQLHEVERMTTEARGSAKRPENLAWLVSMARSQGDRLGRAYLTFGEPIPLRSRLAELRAAGVDDDQLVGRVALDASHRINRATPVTVTALVCLALLGEARALTFDEVLRTISPLSDYIAAQRWPVAGGATLTDRNTVRRALHELVASGVLDVYDAGVESVWQVADDQHLVAAFYRNTVIHILVGRGIAEVALLTAAEDESLPADADVTQVVWHSALAVRDLLKFEFFFPERRDYEAELRGEVALLVPDHDTEPTRAAARNVLDDAPLFVAHLVLRPFVDAYLVLADRLAAYGDSEIAPGAEAELLTDALHLGQQWALQHRIASVESVSLELLRTGLQLARHRGLLTRGEDDPEADLAGRRAGFLAELRDLQRRLDRIAEVAAQRRPTAATPGEVSHAPR